MQGVRIETAFGTIHVELQEQRAPHSCGYFLRDVRDGVYEECSFFRIVTEANQANRNRPAIEVAQGGHPVVGADIPPSIIHENTGISGLHHRRGTISLARYRPGAVYHSFFLCFHDEPSLDYGGLRNADEQGFAAFGQMTEGWAVLDWLRGRSEEQEILRNPIRARVR